MMLNFCQECAEPLTKQTDTLYICPNGHFFYNTPVGASVVVLVNSDNQVLFSQRGNEPCKGKFDFPGGFLQFGETAANGVVRELIEEAGIRLQNPELVTSVCNFYRDNYTTADHIFICTAWDGDPVADDDVDAFEWHPLEFMLSDNFAFPEAFRSAYDILKAKIEER